MPTKSIGNARLNTDGKKTTIVPARTRKSVSARIGEDKKAERRASAYAKSAKGRATITKGRRQAMDEVAKLKE